MTNIHFAISEEPTPPPPNGFVLPSGIGQFWRLRWDEEIPPEYAVRASAFNKNGGTVATRVSREGAFINMDEAHQRWRFEIWKHMAAPEWILEYESAPPHRQVDTMLVKKFLLFFHSTLAWANHAHGSDVRAVYQWGLHLLTPKGFPNAPMAQQMLGSAGATVLQVAPEFSTSSKTQFWIPCKALRPNELLPWEELIRTPWVLNCCTIQRSLETGSNGLHKVIAFDHLTPQGGAGRDVPLILLSNNGVITFNKSLLSPVEAGTKIQCPYNPYRKFAEPLNLWN